jgi:hypothetical protein
MRLAAELRCASLNHRFAAFSGIVKNPALALPQLPFLPRWKHCFSVSFPGLPFPKCHRGKVRIPT